MLVAANHLSYADWAAMALFVHEAGRYPAFMIKSSAFDVKGIGALLRGCGQLPVRRGEADAANVLKVAEQALADGECVVIYPEGTATRDPEQWPMVAKTGVARLALASGVPVVPVATLGGAGHPAVRHDQAAPVAAAHGAHAGRAAGGPDRVRGKAVHPGRAARRHERHHGRRGHAAGRAARRPAAGRAVPPGDRPPGRAPGGPGRGRSGSAQDSAGRTASAAGAAAAGPDGQPQPGPDADPREATPT